MSIRSRLLTGISTAASMAVFGAVMLAASEAAAAPCTGPGAPTTTQTRCVTGILIPGNPLRSFDISWVNPNRDEYYLGDRSNSGIDVIDTKTLKWKRTIGGFVGVVLNSAGTAVNNNLSGPDGVTSHGRWLYGGDGNSTLKVIDLDAPPAVAIKQTISTGGTTRVDEMALDSDGDLIIAANNAEDPPFATLFTANGDDEHSHVSIITKISVDSKIIPSGFGLSLEQPTWEPRTRRFYVSVPIIANNPSGCNYGQLPGPITCHGGMLAIDPKTLAKPNATIGAFDAASNTGVVPLNACSPNGITVGPHENLLEGCTPGNNPSDTITLVINARTKEQTPVANITGSDEVWFNKGDGRYYTGSSKMPGGAVLGVIDAEKNLLIETIPQSANSHSVAADSELNRIFVPQVAPLAVVGTGGDTTAVGAGICGGNSGCIAVYRHRDHDHDDDDHDHDDVAQR